jgi:PKD repeat protein
VRALAGAALVALAVAGCGGPHGGAGLASPSTASPCTAAASPSPVPTAAETAGFSVVINQGQTIERQATVRPQQVLFAVQIAWNQGDVQLSLNTPSGKVYDRTTTDPSANHHVQINAESFAIHNPELGQWTIQLFGASIRPSGEQVGVSETQMPLSDFAPIAVLSGSTDRGVAPLAVNFSGHASGFNGANIASYRWDFGDCSPFESGPETTHVFKAAGSYTVTLTATDSNAQTDFATWDVFVTAYDHPPTAGFLWASLDPSNPTQVSFDAEYGGASKDIDGTITSYAWSFGDGARGVGPIAVHTYSQSGTYSVTLTVTDNGGLTGSITKPVTTGQYDLGTPTPASK